MNSLYQQLIKEYQRLGVADIPPALGRTKALAAPEWIRNGPVYEIFIRAFTPEGTLRSAADKLDELTNLGISTIWLMPIHPTGKLDRKGRLGSPYAIQDYLNIDQALGTFSDFHFFIDRAHEKGIRVLMDMVFNHSATDHPMRKQYPHRFCHDENGEPVRKKSEWTDVVDWDFSNNETHLYLADVAKFWLRYGNVDGFRCDVAGMVPTKFWEELITELQWIKPDVFMLAEWEDARLYRKAFHAGYDWTLYWLMQDVYHSRKPASAIANLIEEKIKKLPKGALELRFAENHDLSRTKKAFGEKSFYPFAALPFFAPGIPLIYTGQEYGIPVQPSLFEKESIDWQRYGTATEVYSFYQRLIKLRVTTPALSDGDFQVVGTTSPEHILAFTRSLKNETLFVVFNLSKEKQDVNLTANQNITGLPKTFILTPFESVCYSIKDKVNEIWRQEVL